MADKKVVYSVSTQILQKLFTLMHQCKNHRFHVKIFADSSTATACINKLGTYHSESCHHITKQIWEWGEKKDIHITAAHIPGDKRILIPDKEPRELSYNLEWMLCPKNLHKALNILKFNPQTDMFANPKAKAVYLLTVSWNPLEFYAFSPFWIISKTLKKIKTEKAEGMLVVP